MSILGTFLKRNVIDLDIFKEYVSNYDLVDLNVEESFIIQLELEVILKKLGSHLTHDLGIFPQWKIYGIFYDIGSIDKIILDADNIDWLYLMENRIFFRNSSEVTDVINNAFGTMNQLRLLNVIL